MNTVPSISEKYAQSNQEDSSELTLWELLFEARGANPARPVLMAALGLDAASADFLAAAVYWRLRMERPFYKFNAPNGHSAYRDGDSWLEELGQSEYTFYRARATVGTKNMTDNYLAETLQSTATDTLVIYWTDDKRMTYYDVRLDLLADKLSAALDVTITAGAAVTIGKAAPARVTPEEQVQRVTEETISAVEAVVSIMAVENAVDNVAATPPNPELLMKTQNPGVTSIHIDKEEVIDIDDFPEVVVQIAKRLQKEGVYEKPSLRIALRTHAAGMDAAATVKLHRAHIRDIRAEGKPPEDWIRLATWRSEHLPLRAARLKKSTPHQRFHAQLAQVERDEAAVLLAEEATTPNERGKEGAQAITAPPVGPTPLPPSPLETQWRRMQGELEIVLTRTVYDQHLRGGRLVALTEDSCIIEVHNAASQEWLEHRLKRRVARVLSYDLQRPIEPIFVVRGG